MYLHYKVVSLLKAKRQSGALRYVEVFVPPSSLETDQPSAVVLLEKGLSLVYAAWMMNEVDYDVGLWMNENLDVERKTVGA